MAATHGKLHHQLGSRAFNDGILPGEETDLTMQIKLCTFKIAETVPHWKTLLPATIKVLRRLRTLMEWERLPAVAPPL